MGKFVTPEVYLIGYTTLSWSGLSNYLASSGNESFIDSMLAARGQGLSDGEILCSLYAKLCYASLSLGKNKNITKVRDIADNVLSCLDSGHGSVFEHCQLNFVVRNCSRVFTHELVRHRVGTAFSQTSGRYVRGDEVNLIFDPILEPIREEAEELLLTIEQAYGRMVKKMGLDEMKDFTTKKQITSALRRFLPNGQSNEIGFSINLCALRHVVQLRTSRQAEWEIRFVFDKVYKIVREKYPMIFDGATEEIVKDLVEVSGMKMSPYEK